MSTRQATILVIDDEEAVRLSFSDHLEDLDYRVLTAENGRTGVRLFEQEKADLVLVDLRMPEMNGLKVMTHIKVESPDTPLIMVSGTGVIADAVEALHQGAWDYILKPVEDFSVLDHAIESALEKARLVRENRHYQDRLEQMVADRTRELHQAYKHLKESEEQHRLVVEKANDGVAMVQDGRFLFVNERLARMMGYDRPEDLVGVPFTEMIHEEDRQRVLGYYRMRQQGKEIPGRYEIRGIRKDGKTVFLDLSATATMHKGKTVNLAFVKDVTEQKRLEAMLLQSQKMEAIGTLAGGIAHDFNNILGVIIGCTELAIMEGTASRSGLQHMRHVLKAGRRAADLVQQILTFSRQREMDKQPLRVGFVVKEVGKMLRATLPATIDIRLDVDPDSGMTMADPAQVHQVVMNLGTNASHAMQETGGVLTLALKNVELGQAVADMPVSLRPGAYLKLTVADTGHGMDSATLERIFDPYFSTKQPEEGTGLGLAVVMGIVKSCDGAVSVSSEPGKGTRFEIFLPRIDDTVQPAQPLSEAAVLPRGTERILLVDDETQLVEISENMLQSLGYRVHVESDSFEALRRFRENPAQFDLVISDVTMPKMTGDELCREILRIRPDMPILLCTGFSHRLTEERAKAIGARELITKPIRIKDLSVRVRNILDASADADAVDKDRA